MNWKFEKIKKNEKGEWVVTTSRDHARHEDFLIRKGEGFHMVDYYKHYGDHEYTCGGCVDSPITGDDLLDLVTAAVTLNEEEAEQRKYWEGKLAYLNEDDRATLRRAAVIEMTSQSRKRKFLEEQNKTFSV